VLELILLVLFFLSSRIAEFVVLGIVLVYGTWAIYMKTYQPDAWLRIQEAEDRRRTMVCIAIASGLASICRQVVDWITPQNP
jgi:hypothetical protein